MTTEAWVKGLKQLVLAFPNRDETEAVQTERGAVYRQHLNDLDDGPWLFAVADAIRSEQWFPSVALLRRYAEAWRPAGLALPPARRTPKEIELGKADARAGLELIRVEAERRGISVPQLVREMPGEKA